MACGCANKGLKGLANQLLTAAPRPTGAVVDLSYAPGSRSQALPALYGLGVNAAWHDRDGRIAARKLPSFPVPAAAMARVGWRTPAGSYALPVNGLGALRFMGAGMGRLSAFGGGFSAATPLPTSYDAARNFTRSTSDVPPASGTVTAIDKIQEVASANKYARVGWQNAKTRSERDITTRDKWRTVADRYRWVYDLATWAERAGVPDGDKATVVLRLRQDLAFADGEARKLAPEWALTPVDGRAVALSVQAALNTAGFRDNAGRPLAVDGNFGGRSQQAYAKAKAAIPAMASLGTGTSDLQRAAILLGNYRPASPPPGGKKPDNSKPGPQQTVVDPAAPPSPPVPSMPDTPVVAQAGMLDFLFESPLMMAGAGLLAVGGIWLATKKK